jgi:hypothetical protein
MWGCLRLWLQASFAICIPVSIGGVIYLFVQVPNPLAGLIGIVVIGLYMYGLWRLILIIPDDPIR